MARFKTRARTIDLLGRQQIAGIPTAISELFKNAHDAYADNAQVDYFRSDGLFVLRDDGVGMTREDFETRWLTIGTESKVQGLSGITAPYAPPNKPPRVTMGEKGIGRLAIGVIGRQVLVLTRAIREDGLKDVVAAFVNWGFFELPGIDIEDIEIPIKIFPGGTLPNIDDVNSLVDIARANLENLSSHISESSFQKIQTELDEFIADPEDLESFTDGPQLSGNGHGTHFYILPSNETIPLDIDEENSHDDNPLFTKFLLGFSNTMTTEHTALLRTEFRDWKTDAPDDFKELIGPSEFFTREEFDNADHHFQGWFDEYGQFSGTIGIYGQNPVSHVVPWGKAAGRKTLCGPFNLNLATVQGAFRESSLSPEDYARIRKKLKKIGGLYIYRDGIRVLPYGNHDVDFLEIEKRRTKSAAYYFFSHRNMAGAIEITNKTNKRLVEKAGREGFQHNKAYRQFCDILSNFFIQIAADFFRADGLKSNDFIDKREELNKMDAARKKAARQSKTKRDNFASSLDKIFIKIEQNNPQVQVQKLIRKIENSIQKATKQKNPDSAAAILIRAENNAKKGLDLIKNEYKISRPRGVGLTKQLVRDWDAYNGEYNRLCRETFEPAEINVAEIIGESAKQARLYVDQRKRLEILLKQTSERSVNKVKSKANETKSSLEKTQTNVQSLLRSSLAEIQNLISKTEIDFQKTNLDDMTLDDIEQLRIDIEQRINNAAMNHEDTLESVKNQLDIIQFSRDSNGLLISQTDMLAAQEDELLAIRENIETDLELTQLGMAVDIINHEFSSSIKTIRANIRKLKGWADINEDLTPLYKNIRSSFEHLDGYLSLFTPLQRRLYRNKSNITGANIANFVADLFKERLKRHNVKLIVSTDFKKVLIKGYPSTFYPVFVNLIDNAIFWIKNNSESKKITLASTGGSFLIQDNGPGIPIRDKNAVFEKGFTRKPGGRGLGLFISKDVLQKSGFDLSIDSSYSNGTKFIIGPIDN
ncbi:MAG: ATP-binding protein [Desulfobacterales bacterium]|nr:ATP-binding protein [Desulfobacterales bacterium]